MFSPASKPENKSQASESSENQPKIPSISLPKGGGAIRGIGEKFTANPVTGTGSLSVPIFATPGRSGFGPQLSISYDSGAGNGIFGFGWNLSLPFITRKTDKGLPQYRDLEESDVFILSGAEDLVPVGLLPSQGNYSITKYRPRIEGLFARIERWTDIQTGDTFWRSISKDNVTTIYGKTSDSRITDPDDYNRVFSWLISESYDDKGNAIYYEYTNENSVNVDINKINEKNRTVMDDKIRTVNRYLRYIRYGNKVPYKPGENLANRTDWMFELAFDYCKRDLPLEAPFLVTVDKQPWDVRKDPFSSYRSGFEVRTYRLCHRILMFHHFPEELEVSDYLVRSTDFTYEESPIASFITKIHQSGYVLKKDPHTKTFKYTKKSLPPLEFEYSKAELKDKIEVIDNPVSLRNLPIGLDGSQYQWVDLDSEGISGIFTEQENAWYYKPNLGEGRFGEIELVRSRPASSNINSGEQQLMDLAGDGQLDLVEFGGPVSGFYERTFNGKWDSFRPFAFIPNISWSNPNLKHVDLSGDGHADILIAEGETFTWYPSLAELGFGQPKKIYLPSDEEKGPRLIFADSTQSVYLADLSGDGLSDIVRIHNRDICYWPNLGYGKFGAKVTMDNSPVFDTPDLFDQKRIRLADIDGSGTTDIVYLNHNGVDVYFNECGNRWSDPQTLSQLPLIDNLSSIMTVDLFGNGTACLVWSSPLPGSASHQMSYIKLVGDRKPHLLVCTKNNLGAETRVEYESSTKYYLEDKAEGKPWVTRLPFPVHVVSRVETYDRISRNLFVTQYMYHHGYFDGIEREFRGFGMVEQLDTEEFDTLSKSNFFPDSTNIDAESHVPPVLTKTWYHTGAYLQRHAISLHMAHEYYGAPDPDNKAEFDIYIQTLLDDTILPEKLTIEEEREACRAMKGSMLRQEIYARDGSPKEYIPYSVSERNYTIRCLQQRRDNKHERRDNKHAVFFVHPRETMDYHYDRNPFDPRISHAMTFEVDDYGNVLKSAAIGYGRLKTDSSLSSDDQNKQKETLVSYTESKVTNSIDNPVTHPNDYRAPLPCETKTYELTGYSNNGTRYCFEDFVEILPEGDVKLSFESELNYEDPYKIPTTPRTNKTRRIIEHIRTLYRSNTLDGLLQLGKVETLALPGESYKLAFTPSLLSWIYQRKKDQNSSDPLLVNSMQILHDDGGYILSQALKSEKDHNNYSLFPSEDPDDHWWIPSGKIYYWPDKKNDPKQELDFATNHFYLPHRFDDPFRNRTLVFYDSDEVNSKKNYNLLLTKTIDPLENTISSQNDYRILHPILVTDPNGTVTEVVLDAFGLVAATAIHKGNEGDSLKNVEANLTQKQVDDFLANPNSQAKALLGTATTRIVYDIDCYSRSGDPNQPPYAATIMRETHASDPIPSDELKIQLKFSYSDGFGREIQSKLQAEPGLVNSNRVDHRWVGSGWIIYNNKGKPVRKYEPFFDDTHKYRYGKTVGVASTLFYDPVGRVVATLHPSHTYEKIVFDPWRQETWDVNDTIQFPDPNDENKMLTDPSKDPDVGDLFKRLPSSEYSPTWYEGRIGGQKGNAEKDAAQKALEHARTPSVAYFDSLGRTFLTVANNGKYGKYKTRVEIDIEGNQRAVIDAKDRTVMQYDYDMLGNKIHQASMEAGERWMLNDITGKPIRAWDCRNHQFRTTYDQLRRPVESYLDEGSGKELRIGLTIYGETQSSPEVENLRGKVYQVFDQAGVVTSDKYDFKGNLLRSCRQLAKEYKTTLDWPSQVPSGMLEEEIFTSSTFYDALNRPTRIIAPHSNKDGTKLNVIQPVYNEANLLEREDVWLECDKTWLEQNVEPDGLLKSTTASQHAVKNIDYNAKGQRKLIEYGNGVSTTYEYDPLTFRLTHLETLRGAEHLQDLFYTYDPAGNIIVIRDDAQQTIFFSGEVVRPDTEYTYDSIYRLIKAHGREHVGQASTPHTTWNDTGRVNLEHPHDGQKMRNYFEFYEYDEVGNILKIDHKDHDINWTRDYYYNIPSLIEPDKTSSNRLSKTIISPKGQQSIPEPYTYDAHGNMTSMLHLQQMDWDFKDQLHYAKKGTEESYYVYDAADQRVRKIVEKNNGGALIEECIYLGGFEIFRRHSGAVNTDTVTLERETLHIMDDKQRIALVETRTIDTQNTDKAPRQLIRYQFGNHLGSASLELDGNGKVISYEEYYPYGSTSYQAMRSETETPKRYRYTGKERDEETGLYYHGARYYAPWLGRWTSCDPDEISDHINLFVYVRNKPIRYFDANGRDSNDSVISTSPHLVEALEAANRANFDDSSVNRLLEVVDKEIRNRGFSYYFTRDAALAHVLIRAEAHARHRQLGNYGRATWHGALGVIDSFGYALYGDSAGQTAKNIAISMVIGATLSRLAAAGRASQMQIKASNEALASRVTARRLSTTPPTEPPQATMTPPSAKSLPESQSQSQSPVAQTSTPEQSPLPVSEPPAQPLRAPAPRHSASRVTQKTLTKETNTVIEPGVDVAGDVAAINAGKAARVNGNWVVNGRTYGAHDGTLYPIEGPGFHQLSRGAFKALGVFNKFGNTEQAANILGKMGISPADGAAALRAFERTR